MAYVMADRNQDWLAGQRQTQGNWVCGNWLAAAQDRGRWRLCFRRLRHTQGCRADDDDDDDYDYDDDDDDDDDLCQAEACYLYKLKKNYFICVGCILRDESSEDQQS